MGAKLGLSCKLYRNTGTYGIPIWSEITIARDVTVSLEPTEADASTRGFSGYKASEPALIAESFEFEILKDTADTHYTALREALLNRTSVDLAAADGAIATAGTTYFRAVSKLFKWENGQPLDGLETIATTAKPCYGSNAPTHVTVP